MGESVLSCHEAREVTLHSMKVRCLQQQQSSHCPARTGWLKATTETPHGFILRTTLLIPCGCSAVLQHNWRTAGDHQEAWQEGIIGVFETKGGWLISLHRIAYD